MVVEPPRSPHARRRAGAAGVLTVLVTSLALTAPVPTGSADELDARKNQVERRIEQSKDDLHHSSSRLIRAVTRLDRAVAELNDARRVLGRARDDVAAAQAHDRRMHQALALAVAEETRARVALAQGRAAAIDREEDLRTVAVQMQASGGSDLMAISAVLRSQEPEQVTGRLSTRRSLLEREAAAVSRLDATEVVLTVQEAALEAAKDEALLRREAAAASLQHKTDVEARAQAAQRRVHEMVSRRRQARQEAAEARAHDRARLRQFREERDRISEQLRRRAAKARALAGARRTARSPGALALPVTGPVTSLYGMRLHPVYQRWALHDGTDFGARCGTPVRAARSGTVIGRYSDSAYGRRVIIDHGWLGGAGLGTSYNHLARYGARVGEQVRRGEVVGFVGSTGFSTGCHLHFMVFRNGAAVNPMGWL